MEGMEKYRQAGKEPFTQAFLICVDFSPEVLNVQG